MHEDDLVFGCELGERTAGADQHCVGDEPAVFVVWLDLVNLRRQLEGVDRRVLGGEEREEITLYPSVALAHECLFLSHMIANITLTTSRSTSNQSARGFDLLPERQTFLGVDGLRWMTHCPSLVAEIADTDKSALFELVPDLLGVS
jgi:hypothetical protein